MAIRRAVLLIADIGGYTHYMHWNRKHLAHAQQTVAGLLEAVIDAGKGLKLAKLEGDAAFFWEPEGDAKALVCEQLDRLSLKFVVHQGEVAEQRIKRHVELVGVDVILVHRMLKNSVPVVEYVLMTDSVAACLDESTRCLCKPLVHHFDGIGETSTHYIDLATSATVPAVPERSFLGRFGANWKFELSAVPFLLGIKKPAEGFRHLDRGTEEISA